MQESVTKTTDAPFPTERDLLVAIFNLLGSIAHKLTLRVPGVRMEDEHGNKAQFYADINKVHYLDLLPGYRSAKVSEWRHQHGCSNACILSVLCEMFQEPPEDHLAQTNVPECGECRKPETNASSHQPSSLATS
jgi:hypothetical protein